MVFLVLFLVGFVLFSFWKTPGFLLSPILQHVGIAKSKTKRFDDRQSLERARHELKKKDSFHDVISDGIRSLQGRALGEVYLEVSIELVRSLRALIAIVHH